VEFFIPTLEDDPIRAEEAWQWYASQAGATPDVRRIYRLTYLHEGDRYEVTVGKERQRYRRQTGPRGGYRANAGHVGFPESTGTIVAAIMAAQPTLQVWSLPPYGGWANPSLVGTSEVDTIEYFDRPTT
jgi:hypothetical protein